MSDIYKEYSGNGESKANEESRELWDGAAAYHGFGVRFDHCITALRQGYSPVMIPGSQVC